MPRDASTSPSAFFAQLPGRRFSYSMSFSPGSTQNGRLPPWEVAKAAAYNEVISDMEKHLGKSCWQLLGQGKVPYVRSKLTLVGGGSPNARSVRATFARCNFESWYPGKAPDDKGGRPPTFSGHVKGEVARVAMETKGKLLRVTPERCRALLPKKTINKKTGKPMSDKTFQRIFTTRCYDEREDDPWCYLPAVQQDYLPATTKPHRVACCDHILGDILPAGAHHHTFSVDPCKSLILMNEIKTEEQKVAAMGSVKYQSKGSRRKCSNPRATKYAAQASGAEAAHWTPILARGKIKIYLCGLDDDGPEKLNDSDSFAQFIRNCLPRELQAMQEEHGWPNVPRAMVHDKASYFVTPANHRLNPAIASALGDGGFRSWVGDGAADVSWLSGRLGDMYPHETAISHIRRLLSHKFPCGRAGETLAQFRRRLDKVEEHMNSDEFRADGDAESLLRICQCMRQRCQMISAAGGERIPK